MTGTRDCRSIENELALFVGKVNFGKRQMLCAACGFFAHSCGFRSGGISVAQVTLVKTA